MDIRHDPENNIAYIRFMPKMTGVETIELSGDVNIDLAPNGALYGIELLNANEQLKADGGVLHFLNVATKFQQEFPI
ncbi:MAG: DUF2283 domain-containing protein [Alphaproteobacteria bacterium]|nr:DUF2283 domain-containing protein [Alphaproteobacteria bacterium]